MSTIIDISSELMDKQLSEIQIIESILDDSILEDE